MVYQVGDTIVATVTVAPFDGTTTVTATLTCQSTAVVTHPTATPGLDHSTWTVPFTPGSAGQWVLLATVTGVGAGVQSLTYDVQAIPPVAITSMYATTAAYAAYYPDEPAPARLTTLLRRASRDVDAVLLSATYDITDSALLAVLSDATCEQVAYLLAQGLDEGIPVGAQSAQILSVSLTRGYSSAGGQAGVPPFSPQAFAILQLAGLTGMAPATWY